jgi:hypothetical protein
LSRAVKDGSAKYLCRLNEQSERLHRELSTCKENAPKLRRQQIEAEREGNPVEVDKSLAAFRENDQRANTKMAAISDIYGEMRSLEGVARAERSMKAVQELRQSLPVFAKALERYHAAVAELDEVKQKVSGLSGEITLLDGVDREYWMQFKDFFLEPMIEVFGDLSRI